MDWNELTVKPTLLGRGLASLAQLPRRLWHAASVAGDILSWAARLRLREGLRLQREERLVRRAWLLDPEFYLGQCGDNEKARRNPIRHYLRRGAARGLDPNPYFETSWYVERYRSVTDLGLNPLIHYLRHGARLALDPGPRFDTASYLARCPGAATSGLAPLSHFFVYGLRAGLPCAPPAALEEVGPVLSAPVFRRALRQDHPARNRVLVVDHRMLTPDQDSGSVRMFAIVRLLRDLGHDVTFVAGYDFGGASYRQALSRHASTILIGQEAATAHLWEEGGSYRFAILSRPELSDRYRPVVREFAPQATLIFDTVDLHWVRLMRAAEVTQDRTLLDEAERFRRMERACVAESDLTLAITEQERSTILGEVPGANVVVIPNIHAVQAQVKPLERRRDLFFIGGYGHPPNADAVRWFIADILPRIRDRIPEVQFHVVGADPPNDVRRLAGDGIHVVGWVPDAAQYFEGCRVFVSPLRYGAGMKGKIGQAMSFGLPVVTTSIGAEGMLLVHDENALVADEPAAFADAVIRLYESPALWSSLSEASWRHVQRHFSEGAVRQKLAAIFPAEGTVLQRGTVAAAKHPA